MYGQWRIEAGARHINIAASDGSDRKSGEMTQVTLLYRDGRDVVLAVSDGHYTRMMRVPVVTNVTATALSLLWNGQNHD